VVADHQGRIVLANTQALLLFGYGRAELLGQPVEILVPEGVRAQHAWLRAGYLAEPRTRPMGTGAALVARDRAGREFHVEIGLAPLETRDGPLVVSSIRDISERVRVAEELRTHRDRLEELIQERTAALTRANTELRTQAALLARERQEILTLNQSLEAKERFIRNVIESLRDGIVILDLARRIVGWNHALQVHSGIPVAEVAGRPFFDAFPTLRREGLEPFLDRLYAGEEEAFSLERLEHLSRATGPMALNLQGSVIRGPGSRLEGVVLVLENISERVRLEQSVQESEKLAAIGTLAAGLAHEINNPIGIMISRIELMLTEAEAARLPASLLEDLGVLARNARRVGRITQGLLSFARRTQSRKGPVDLNALVEDTLVLFEGEAAKSGIAVTRRLAPGLPSIEGDANQLQQVLVNLLKNAREALADRGEIRVETGLTRDRPGWIQLAVSDTGPGIPPDIKSRIFVPFFTTKETGTGLGLSVSYRIVKDHGGILEAWSEPGEGTAFTVLLPAPDRAR
jgi:PAS domain S-box-containing protein